MVAHPFWHNCFGQDSRQDMGDYIRSKSLMLPGLMVSCLPDWVNDTHLVLQKPVLVSLIRQCTPLLLNLLGPLFSFGTCNLNILTHLGTSPL